LYPRLPLSPSNSSSSKSTPSQEIGVRRTLRTEELSRDVQGLASHNYDLLAIEQLLSNSAGQPTKEVTLAIDRDLIKTKASAIRSIIPIHPKLDQQKASPVLMRKKVTTRQGGTYDWLEGRHVCPASRRMRRQKSEGLPVSSTFVMVEEFCRFVVGIVLEVFQRIGEDKSSL
jgi:hypothetical protein